MPAKIKHIAVMRLSAMGDVAMTVPVLRALAKQYPELQLTVISRPFFQAFFQDIPRLSFFAFDEKNRHKGFLGVFRLFFDLKKQNIDAFADLHNVLRSKKIRFLFAFSGKKTAVVNKGRAEKKALTRPKNKIFKPLASMFERHQLVFEKLGFPVDLSCPEFSKKIPFRHPTFEAVLAKSEKRIGIAPFAQYESKVYPLDLMQEVISDLATNTKQAIFLFGGGKKEKELLQTLVGNHKNVFNMAGNLSFKDELNLISHLDVMLAMDSGNAHIAALLGIKVVTLWGATHPYAGFLPFNQPQDSALLADRNQYPQLPTSVYGNKKIAGYENVMRSILPEQIVLKIKSQLGD